MFKRLWQWIKKPHGLWLIPLYIFSAAVIACAVVLSVVGQGKGYDIVAYIFYALAAVMLGYCIYTFVLIAPKAKANALKIIKSNGFTNRLYEHYGFRTVVFALVSLAISAANAVFNGVIGILYEVILHGFRSVQFCTLEREIGVLHFAVAVLFRGRSCVVNVIVVNENTCVLLPE